MIDNMTRLEFFERGFGLVAFRLGLLPVNVIVHYDLYKTYLDFLDRTKDETEARKLTEIERNVSQFRVSRAICFIEARPRGKRKKKS